MSALKIAFLGAPAFSVPSLEILNTLDFVKIEAVITHPDKPKGRNLVLSAPPVKVCAEKCNLKVYQPERVSSPDFISILKSMSLDLIVIVSFGEILSGDVLNTPRLGCINVHSSLLPKYRGAAPVVWALMNGDRKTGVTTFWLTEKMDSGDIILQKEIDILSSDTRGLLEEKLSNIGAEILKDTLNAINKGNIQKTKQDVSKITYAPKISKKDGLIDLKNPAESIHNKIRAMNPWPGAHMFMKGLRVEVWESEFKNVTISEPPGTVVLLDKSGIGIATASGILIIKELQVEGKRRVKAEDFIHGYRINEGFVF
jgi:methionyl-tRNA formyltransferase